MSSACGYAALTLMERGAGVVSVEFKVNLLAPARRDDFDAAIAAHYVARHQPTPNATLEWNERALKHADAAPDHRAAALLPSSDCFNALPANRSYHVESTSRNSILPKCSAHPIASPSCIESLM
jgi:hypothetical protein